MSMKISLMDYRRGVPPSCKKRRLRFPGHFLPHRFAGELYLVRIMHYPVQYGVRYCRLAYNLVPLVHRNLSSYDSGAQLMPVLEDFQEVPSLHFVQ